MTRTELIAALEAAGLAKPDPETGCWLWQRKLDARGRGRIWVDGRPRLAHREVWRRANGPIQNGKLLCHHCDNPQCVNPAHLYVGTHADNMRDMRERKRSFAARHPERAKEVGRKTGLMNNWVRGEDNPRSKLNAQQVEWIRKDPRPTRYVAADYGVHRTTIQRIRSGKHWPALEAQEEA